MKAWLTRALVFALPCLAMAQIAVLQIKVIEGDGGVHPAGAHVARPLTVEVTDDSGRPVAGAAVSFQLPASGPSGLFSNGLRTDLSLTDANGRAFIHAVQLNRTGGPMRIRITAVKEQARAGVVSLQYIGGGTANAGAAAAVTPTAAAVAKPAAESGAPGARSGDITPTTAKMGTGRHKKWLVLAAIAAGGSLAFVGVSRAKSKGGSSSLNPAASMGTPIITIGHP